MHLRPTDDERTIDDVFEAFFTTEVTTDRVVVADNAYLGEGVSLRGAVVGRFVAVVEDREEERGRLEGQPVTAGVPRVAGDRTHVRAIGLDVAHVRDVAVAQPPRAAKPWPKRSYIVKKSTARQSVSTSRSS